MPKTKNFRSVRPLKPFDSIYPEPFDPREKVFVPDLSIGNNQISDVDVRKVKVYAAKVYNSAAFTVADATATTITFNTTEYDQGGFFDGSDTFIAPFEGLYIISAYIAWTANVTGERKLIVNVNAVQLHTDIKNAISAGTETPLSLTIPQRLMEGDEVSIQGRQSSGGNLDIRAGSDDNYLAIVYVGEV